MSLNGTAWTPIGPSPSIWAGSQRMVRSPPLPSIRTTLTSCISAAWGGIWRTRNGGAHWTPIFDQAPSLGIGEPGGLAIDPVDTNIIYAGTSNRDGSQFSGEYTQPPAGLFKSTDGGFSLGSHGFRLPVPSAPSNASIFFNRIINIVLVDLRIT